MEQRQRMSTIFTEFDLMANEQVSDEAEFELDTIDFCFRAQPYAGEIRCFVKLWDYWDGSELLNGQIDFLIKENDQNDHYVSFSGFGYHDDERGHPIGKVKYDVWLDGDDRVRVQVLI